VNNAKKSIFYIVLIIFFVSCKDGKYPSDSTPIFQTFPSKTYVRDNTTGNMISTEIDTADFHASDNCIACHPNHVADWNRSMHAYSMRDPIFFSGWYNEQLKNEHTGERFCVQCHSPVAYLSGQKLDQYTTVEDLQNDPALSMSIKEGITCTVCHSMTGESGRVETDYDIAARAEYTMNPGENIMYGSLEIDSIDCVEGLYCHEVQYNSLFKFSESCLPCHEMTVRGKEVEMTFSEWNDIPAFGMGGLVPCQDCHMPVKDKQYSDASDRSYYSSHEFLGVDIDLTRDISESSEKYQSVQTLLQSTLELEFGGSAETDIIRIENNNTLIIPITITSHSGHSFPSGTSFSRQAWLETIVTNIDDNSVLFSSGVIENKTDNLDLNDSSLLLYTSYLLDENGDTTNSVTDAYDIIRQMLPGQNTDNHTYTINGTFFSGMEMHISIKMRFRAFKPSILAETFLTNNMTFQDCIECNRQPVFTMTHIETNFIVP
tara:strand:+ start:784 stop:2247 length:1464 start_codon:yes stop_codon:yes gene_type:complete